LDQLRRGLLHFPWLLGGLQAQGPRLEYLCHHICLALQLAEERQGATLQQSESRHPF
jgi:hypothetical protein